MKKEDKSAVNKQAKKIRKKREQNNSSVNQEQLIYQRIFDAILEQKLIPGARLTEKPLADIFGVSRTIVRQALLRLSHEGVVEITPNKGASVVSTPVEKVEDYFTARKIVECSIARIATGKASQYQILSLKALLSEEKRYFESGTRGKGLSASSEFHLQIADICDNQPLIEIARKLVSRTALIVSQYQDLYATPCAYADHDKLIEAIDTGTPDEAEKLMAEHIDHIFGTLVLHKKEIEPDLFEVFSKTEDKKDAKS